MWGCENVLADHMEIRRPKLLKLIFLAIARCSHIIYQSIKPNISYKFRIKRQWDTPGQALLGPRNAKVIKGLFKEFKNLILSVIGGYEGWVFTDMFNQPVLVLP
tara:strand:- start:587 stop:898 length:312 start_codon:yes stop_codon:yes gene_type:complete